MADWAVITEDKNPMVQLCFCLYPSTPLGSFQLSGGISLTTGEEDRKSPMSKQSFYPLFCYN